MIKNLFIFFSAICFVVFSVSCILPAYTTKHGINVYHKTKTLTPSKKEVEISLNYIIHHLGEAEDFKGWNLYIFNELFYFFKVNGEMVVADGYTDTQVKNVWVSFIRTCFADSSLIHELAHVLYKDPFHFDKVLWENIKKIEKQMIKDLCPKDYVHIETPTNHEPGQILEVDILPGLKAGDSH